MNLVYYAHSYRKPDAPVVEFFSELMRSEGLVASLDPPSDRLNSAKPERHLRSTDGMVAVLTAREGGVSKYILYEVSLCLRAGKPLLVFIEDTLPSGLVSARVLQRRFSRKALLRQVRDHRHAVRAFRSYIGDEPPPAYQPSTDMRRCLLAGSGDLPASVADRVATHLGDRGYFPEVLCGNIAGCLYDAAFQEKLNSAELAVAFVNSNAELADFFLGAIRAAFVPSILLSCRDDLPFHEQVPREYQARLVNGEDFEGLQSTLDDEIAIFEEEYVDLENQEQVTRYSQLLLTQTSMTAQYSQGLRNLFVQELHMGDQNINYGQAGAIGRQSTGTVVNYGQAWDEIKGGADLNVLASELAQLRSALRQKAQTIEEDKAVVAVAEAESEAKSGNGPGAMQRLAAAGAWALNVAKEIGVKLATEALKKSLGM